MSKVAIEYYEKKFGSDVTKAFVHLVREIGEIAFALERNNTEHAKVEITESVALLHFIAQKYGLDLESNIDSMYRKKLETLAKSDNTQK
jgi:NTP pyrophosphatase (non-canonical NTP hydrolase)